MSRSVEITPHVCKKFLKWNSKNGSFEYYDKEIENEEERNVEVSLPLSFIVLDRLATIKGWSDSDESGIWSNELKLKDIGSKPFIVKTKKGVIVEGLNKDIKAEYKEAGGKYHESVYILPIVEGELSDEVWNLQLGKSALTGGNKAGENDGTGWMAFTKKVGSPDQIPNFVVCKDFKSKKNKAVAFNVPVFEKAEKLTDEQNEMAKQADIKLQEYLKYYFNRPVEKLEAVHTNIGEEDDSDYDN